MEIRAFIDKYLNIINDKFNLILCVILFIGVTAIFLLLSQVDERMTQNIIQIRGIWGFGWSSNYLHYFKNYPNTRRTNSCF